MASSRYLNLSSYFRPAPRSLKVGVEMNRGAYGTVHVGELNGQPVAVKKIHRLLLEAASGERESWEKVVRDFEQECRLLENLKHPHIVGFSGAFYEVESKEPILVMERMKENLRDLLGLEDGLSLDRQLVICLSIARALEFLHSRSPPTVHRDLNDKNVMLDEKGVVKVGDLGQSRLKEQSVDYFSTGQPGAVPFMPPEALSDKPHYTEKIDMFSLGVLMLEVATGRHPSVKLVGIGRDPEVVRRRGDLSRLADGHPLKPFILECLKDDYKERPPAVLVRCFVESQVVSDPMSLCIFHFIPHVHCTMYTVPCTLYTVYTAPCTLHHVHCAMYTVPCTLYTMYTVLCTLHHVHSTMYTVPCTLYHVHCTVYTAPCVLRACMFSAAPCTKIPNFLQEKHDQIKEIKEKDVQLQLKDAQIHQYRKQLTEKDTQLKQKDTQLKQKDEDSGREYALLLQDYQQLQQERDRLKREHDQLKASQQKPSPPASVQPLSIQPHQHKTPTKLLSANKQVSI